MKYKVLAAVLLLNALTANLSLAAPINCHPESLENVTAVRFPNGSIQLKTSNPDGSAPENFEKWIEKRADGSDAFVFTRTFSDIGKIGLYDESRDLALVVDIVQNWILWRQGNQKFQRLYNITGIFRNGAWYEFHAKPSFGHPYKTTFGELNLPSGYLGERRDLDGALCLWRDFKWRFTGRFSYDPNFDTSDGGIELVFDKSGKSFTGVIRSRSGEETPINGSIAE